jgi:hypothetical protein
MKRLYLALLSVSLDLCVGCNRRSDFITETSPFLDLRVATPSDGKFAIAVRGERFAKQHGMKVHFVPDHIAPREYSLSLTRSDLNIVAANGQSGSASNVAAYARSAPSAAQRAEVEAYLCEVMLHGCSP